MTSRVLVAFGIAATPKRASDVFTREIGAWWQPNAVFKFTPRSPGVRLQHPMGFANPP